MGVGVGGPSYGHHGEKSMGARGSTTVGGIQGTQNQNNSILGRRSTRVAAPPGGGSSMSLGWD